MDGWMDGSKEQTKVIKAEGAWAPRLRMGLLQAMQVQDWVVGSRCCRSRPRRTLEPGQQSRHISEKLPAPSLALLSW